MILEEFMNGATESNKIIIEDSTGELYRGYVACLKYSEVDKRREIKKHGLSTDICKKERKRFGAIMRTTMGEKVPIENINKFTFSDLEMMIYTRIVLEG